MGRETQLIDKAPQRSLIPLFLCLLSVSLNRCEIKDIIVATTFITTLVVCALDLGNVGGWSLSLSSYVV